MVPLNYCQLMVDWLTVLMRLKLGKIVVTP